MMPARNQTEPYLRTSFVVAGSVGVLLSVFALFLLTLPRWNLLTQWPQFPLPTRVLLLLEIASPLLCLLICAAWIAAIRWLWALTTTSGRQQQDEAQGQETRSQLRAYQPSHASSLSQRAIAVPPLFQRDPTDPVPVSPFPRFSAQVPPPPPALDIDSPVAQMDEEQRSEPISQPPQGNLEENDQNPLPAFREERSLVIIPPAPALPMVQQQEPGRESTLVSSFPVLPDPAPARPSPLVTLSLLGRVRVWLQAPDGTRREVPIRRGERGIRQIALAYVAWRRGEAVERDKLLEHIFARGHRKEFRVEQLNEAFDGVKRFLREDLRRAVHDLNVEAGGERIAEKSASFFLTEPGGFYRLHPSCRVTDLETMEFCSTQIALAREAGLLDGKQDALRPSWVIATCQQCLEAYTGDFLHELISYFPEEFGPWVREPSTRYRDVYLEALWILASYESALGKQRVSDSEAAAHQSRAAHYFRTYAMHAITSRADNKLKFAYQTKDSKDRERVIMSERAIRRCIVELGKLGRTDLIDQCYLSYKEKMLTLSEGRWKPDPETEEDIATARKQTSAYRFSAQIASQEERVSHP